MQLICRLTWKSIRGLQLPISLLRFYLKRNLANITISGKWKHWSRNKFEYANFTQTWCLVTCATSPGGFLEVPGAKPSQAAAFSGCSTESRIHQVGSSASGCLMMLGSHSCGYRCIYITNMYIQIICYAYNYIWWLWCTYIAYMCVNVFVYCVEIIQNHSCQKNPTVSKRSIKFALQKPFNLLLNRNSLSKAGRSWFSQWR